MDDELKVKSGEERDLAENPRQGLWKGAEEGLEM